MKQFMEVKEEYPDAIVLFRMGDFYECFYEDAIAVSKILQITLTSRGKGESQAPLAGIPYHALDKYLKKLVDSGRKIALCEQIEDPKTAKGVVKRAVTRVITPGTVVEESVLSDSANNFVVSLFCDGEYVGLAGCDISTGELFTTEFSSFADLFSELAKLGPKELVVSPHASQKIIGYASRKEIFITKLHEYHFWITKAEKKIQQHFTKTPQELGLGEKELSICATGALLAYLSESQKVDLSYITKITKYSSAQYLQLSEQAIVNLELLKTLTQKKKGSLLALLDQTQTSMGSRLLKKWLLRPLIHKEHILKRQSVLREFIENSHVIGEYADLLSLMCDLERMLSRVTYAQVNARDLVNLKESLTLLPKITRVHTSESVSDFVKFIDVTDLVALLDKTLKDECPLSIREGNFIKRGFNAQLDELWELKTNSQKILSQLEQKLIAESHISTLKIRYNRVFGYFIEVSQRNAQSVPEYFVQKQMTVNSVRYVTDELKELEVKLLSAQDKIQALEYTLFQEVVSEVAKWTTHIQKIAESVSVLDCLVSLAKVSRERGYVQPVLTEHNSLDIVQGRHPVLELDIDFIANDCHLSESTSMMVITGPNMAGKSTYMRQNALLIIMAQMGCFVPAQSAKIGIVDGIYTRIGSRDDLSQGQSTFMVEMTEVATILHNATERSFIILDEIGSGTSTYDGVAIAWSVALDISRRIKAKTLFSTHYHVLTKLGDEPNIANFNVAVSETNGDVVFLRKIIPGGTDKSYGIHVAKLAGLPRAVLDSAQKIQAKLEGDDILQHRIVLERVGGDENKLIYAKAKQKTLVDLSLQDPEDELDTTANTERLQNEH